MAEELSPSQAAARIGATTRSVQRWIASGRLPARRLGGRWRVASDALDAFAGLSGGPSHATADAATRITAGSWRPSRPMAGRSAPHDQIRRLFVANRGEIARRIARTCDRLGVHAVIPSTDGPGALDLLDIDAVVAAARGAGADALHPGFGFLAENAAFAQAVIGAGIRWVGPPPDAIRTMGDKAGARHLATRLAIPILPGYDDRDQSDEALLHAAEVIGLPVLVKPSAGGGGKGMRVVRHLEDLPDALASSRREATAAFGDDRLILERHLDGPRHIEIQVLFDEHGTGVHLGERDCSIQRRHQKVFEEAPSPVVDAALRTRLVDAALRLAGAVGYANAGTVEFLVDDAGTFSFLEMNTRLQVEHPVTELVTGRDLVADQLRIAAGEPLGLAQSDIRLHGHAMEARLYAEDADAGFLPATGRVETLRWPEGDGIRVDAGIAAGDEVTGRFDPMLAKLIAHGRDRAEALERLSDALDGTVVLGLTTNLRFLRWLVRQPSVRDGQARTDTLDRTWPPGDLIELTAIPDDAWRAAAELLVPSAASGPPADPWAGSWRVNAPTAIRLQAEGVERLVALGPADGTPADAGRRDGPASVRAGDTAHVDVDGRSVSFRVAPPPDVDRAARSAALQHGGAPSQVIAPMPGAVIAVHAVAGQAVDAGDPIATLEAMKMEHVVAAPVGGMLAEIRARPGDQVVRGQLLAIVEP